MGDAKALRGAKRAKPFEISPVGGQGIDGGATFGGEQLQKRLDVPVYCNRVYRDRVYGHG